MLDIGNASAHKPWSDAHKDPAGEIKGMPPNFGDGLLPHVVTFQGIVSSISKVYRASDEALKDSYENARFMRNDTTIMECLEQRQRSVALLGWHIEPEDKDDADQKEVCERLTAILERVPRFMQLRENLLHALWFGKYGTQLRYRWRDIQNRQVLGIDRWMPVHGDKIVFRYDDSTGQYDPDQVGIRVGPMYTLSGSKKKWANDQISRIEPTDYGLAYFLTPWERPLLAIHKHMIEDGEYDDPANAGRVHGVGIRSRIYWTWYQKQESLAWLMEYLERSAFGIEMWYYPWGNDTARERTRKAAEERIGQGRNIVLVPRVEGSEMAYGVDRIEPGMAGADMLKSVIQEYFGHLIKRYILGQTLTTESASTGLGSNLASIHLDTYLQIVRYDAINLQETITEEIVKPLIAFNWPKYQNAYIRFMVETEAPDVEAKLEAWKKAYEMGCRLKASDVMELIGASAPEGDDDVLEDPQHVQARAMVEQGEQERRAQVQGAGFPGPNEMAGELQDNLEQAAVGGVDGMAGPMGAAGPLETMPVRPAGGKEPPSEESERRKVSDYVDPGDPERYQKDFQEAAHPRDSEGKFTATEATAGEKSGSPRHHGLTSKHAESAGQALVAKLTKMSRSENVGLDKRQYLGQVKDYLQDGIPDAILNTHVFFDPDQEAGAAIVGRNRIEIGPGGFAGMGSSGTLGETFLHEVEHLRDIQDDGATNEYKPRLRQMLRNVADEGPAMLVPFARRDGMDEAENYVAGWFDRHGYSLEPEELEDAARKLVEQAREHFNGAGGGDEQPDSKSEKPKPRNITESPEFQKWFDDSKVVDSQGKPLMVYHGTNVQDDFSQFTDNSGSRGSADAGMYFSADVEYAGQYAGTRGSSRIMPVYLKITNPLHVASKGQVSRSGWFTQEDIDSLISQGYDGLNVHDGEEWVVFSPNQVKSATGNRGTFDPGDDRINYAARELDNVSMDMTGLFTREFASRGFSLGRSGRVASNSQEKYNLGGGSHFREEDHPRDESGKFAKSEDGENGMTPPKQDSLTKAMQFHASKMHGRNTIAKAAKKMGLSDQEQEHFIAEVLRLQSKAKQEEIAAHRQSQEHWAEYKSRHPRYHYTGRPDVSEGLSLAAETIAESPGWKETHTSPDSTYFQHQSGVTVRVANHPPAYLRSMTNHSIHPTEENHQLLVGGGDSLIQYVRGVLDSAIAKQSKS